MLTHRHPPRRHVWDRRRPPEALFVPPAGVLVTSVGHVAGQRFCWYFDAAFDDPPDPETEDFAGLWIAGNAPVAIDEIVGADGTVTLLYALDAPDEPGLQWELLVAPPCLFFPRPLGVPQVGFTLG